MIQPRSVGRANLVRRGTVHIQVEVSRQCAGASSPPSCRVRSAMVSMTGYASKYWSNLYSGFFLTRIWMVTPASAALLSWRLHHDRG